MASGRARPAPLAISANVSGAFPLPTIPLPHGTSSRSRRLQLRLHRATAAHKLANLCVQSLNALSTSFSPHQLPSSSHHERIRTRLLSRILSASRRFVGRQESASSSSDGTDSTQFLPDIGYSKPFHSAVPIVASKVSLPAAAGTARLLELLPPHLAQQYSSPELLLRPTPARCKSRASVFCESRQEYIDLIFRLQQLDMIRFETSVFVVNGLFAVPKDQDSLRLIIDARPANAVFGEPAQVHLPTPDLLSQLQASSHDTVFAAKVDLDNFYHRLRLPDWMVKYFGLPPLHCSELGLPGDHVLYPCCTTLPMGWSHSVFVAQSIHEHLLDSRTPLSPSDRIHSSSDLRLDRPRHLVYIDDLILVGTASAPLEDLQQRYMDVMTSVNLPPKMSKVVPPSSTGVECLGLEIDGVNKTVGLCIPKMQLLIRDTLDLLDRGVCTGIDMAHIVGRWSWAVLCCRPAFAVFNAVYRFIEAARRRVFTIWESVKKELVVMVGLAPVLWSSLDSPWFDRIVATDASEIGMGVVAAHLPDHHAVQLASGPPVSNPPPALHELHPNFRWSTIVSAPWTTPEHINVLELRSVSTAIRWVLSSPHSIGRRLLCLSDSQVVVFAISKGRSSSFQLLRRLRYLSALVLASGLQLLMRWIPSAANPADQPSRHVF